MSYSPLAVVVAAYNEEEGIAPTLCELKAVLNAPNLVVVDGKSSDRTLELAKDLGAKVLIQRSKGKGKRGIGTEITIRKKSAEVTGGTKYLLPDKRKEVDKQRTINLYGGDS